MTQTKGTSLNSLFESIIKQEKRKKQLYDAKIAAQRAYEEACKKEEVLELEAIKELVKLDEQAFILLDSSGSFCFTVSKPSHSGDRIENMILNKTKAHRY